MIDNGKKAYYNNTLRVHIMTYNHTNLSRKPRVTSAKVRTTDLPRIGESNQQTPSIKLQDYVNAFIINEDSKVLVLEGTDNGRSWSSWQMVGRGLTLEEDPVAAIQQDLLLRTGYVCKNWTYLGSFVVDETQKIGAGHFFCATTVDKINHIDESHKDDLRIKWVSKRELKQALVDGRIAVINHAVAASLAMVMCNQTD